MKTTCPKAAEPLIACVDDDLSVREALHGLVGAFDLMVRTFESAEAFLASEFLDQVSCLITDIQLGGMSGLQLQKHLIATNRRLPTIVITAFNDALLHKSALDAGAVEVLIKPVKAEQLLSAIRKALIGGVA